MTGQKRLETLREHFRSHRGIKEMKPHSSKVHTGKFEFFADSREDSYLIIENIYLISEMELLRDKISIWIAR